MSAALAFAAGPLGPMLPAFLARYPEVRVVLSFDNRPVDQLADDVDVAIRVGPLRDSELIARRLARLALWPCASPAYLAARGTPATVDALRGHAMITPFDRAHPWRFRTLAGVLQEFVVESGTVIPEPAVARTVLLGGAGIGRLPEYHAADAVADGTLIRLLPDHEPDTVDAHALYPRHRSLSVKVRVFVDALVAHLASSRPG